MDIEVFKKRLEGKKYNILLLLLLFLISVIKVFIIIQSPGPVIYGDELLYKRRAAEIFYHHTYQGTSYPAGYPLILSVSFLFGDYFYFVMKLINVFLTTVGIWGIWKLSRMFLKEKEAFLCTLSSAFLPFPYMMCSRIMSENLYFPLVIFACYFFLKAKNNNTLKNRLITGVFLLAMHLTRHVTIVILPVFVLGWILDYKEEKGWRITISKNKIIELLQIFSVHFTGYAVWVFFMLYQGIDLYRILGLNISGGIGADNIKSYATGESLFKITVLYLSYYILSLSFMLPHSVTGIFVLLKNKKDKVFAEFILLAVLLSGALGIASIRHSWRAAYNYPEIFRIMGRYIYYFVPLWLIIFFVSTVTVSYDKCKKKLFGLHIGCAVLFVIALQALVIQNLFKIRENFLSDFNTKELYYIKDIYIWLIAFWIIGLIVLIFKTPKYRNYMTGVLMITLCSGMLQSISYDDYEHEGIFGVKIKEFNEEYGWKNYQFFINDTTMTNLEMDMDFWTIHTQNPVVFGNNTDYGENNITEYYKKYWPDTTYVKLINLKTDKNPSFDVADSGKGVVLCRTSDLYETLPCKKFNYKGVEYGLYEYPIELTQSLKIVTTYPDQIVSGQKFNEQPDGTSALAIETNFFNQEISVYINGSYAGNAHTGPDGIAGIGIADSLYKEPGTITVRVELENAQAYINNVASAEYRIMVK